MNCQCGHSVLHHAGVGMDGQCYDCACQGLTKATPQDPRDPPMLSIPDAVDLMVSEGHGDCFDVPSVEESIMAVQGALEAMIALYGGERVAKWVRDLTFLIERKELP